MVIRPPVKPLVAIVGATGTGKSNLAVCLAEQLNGEVINADSLQLYEGLPIVTNKILAREMRGVKHHLLGRISLDEEPWTVGQFTAEASTIIESIRATGKLPIVVGGTHYYTQSLIFEGQLVGDQSISDKTASKAGNQFSVLERPTCDILEKLKEVDPIMASRWHPHDRRRIRRSLEIWLQTGRKASEIYAEQRPDVTGSRLDGMDAQAIVQMDARNCRLRSETLLFWIHADRETLNERLSRRVDTMLNNGLLSEVQQLRAFHANRRRAGHIVDDSRGVRVAIGCKEFDDYLQALDTINCALNLSAMKAAAIERTKIATRQYAKRQERWIKQKLLPKFRAAGKEGNAFLLDGTNLDDWTSAVLEKACSITKDFLAGSAIPSPVSLSGTAFDILSPTQADNPTIMKATYCEACNVTTLTDQQLQLHQNSKKHKKLRRRRVLG